MGCCGSKTHPVDQEYSCSSEGNYMIQLHQELLMEVRLTNNLMRFLIRLNTERDVPPPLSSESVEIDLDNDKGNW
jgi:hypothetical protein